MISLRGRDNPAPALPILLLQRPALDVAVKGLPSHTVKVGAGQTRVLRAVITNKGNTTITDGVWELVPSDPSLTMLLPSSKGVVPLWTAAINLAPKKSMRFVAKVMFPRCSPAGHMSFAALINDIPGPVVNVGRDLLTCESGRGLCGEGDGA